MNAEFLSGLPGVGPEPIHCFMKDAAPWSEGQVVKFSGLSRADWVANLQTGWGYASKIVDWPEASAAIVIAKGAIYLLRPESPGAWRFYDSLGIECVISPDGRNAVISTYEDVMMIDVNGQVAWRRTLAIDGIEIRGVTNDWISGRLCYDPPDGWSDFRVSRVDGCDV